MQLNEIIEFLSNNAILVVIIGVPIIVTIRMLKEIRQKSILKQKEIYESTFADGGSAEA